VGGISKDEDQRDFKPEHYQFNFWDYISADSTGYEDKKKVLLNFVCLLQNAFFYALPFNAGDKVQIVEGMFQVFSATCNNLKISFVTSIEKLVYHDMYRLINCTVRYLRGTAIDANGGYLWYRLRKLCPDKFLEQIFKAVKRVASRLQDDGIKKLLAPFAQFDKDVTTNGNFDPSFFYLPCFSDLLHNIGWDSNALDVGWNPTSYKVKSGADMEIWPKGKLSRTGPQKFIDWVRSALKPVYDPMFLILYICNKLNMINNKCYDERSPKLFFLTDVSPRFKHIHLYG